MAAAGATLPAETRMGEVGLTVADLERSLRYYGTVVGLRVLERQNGRASLGAGVRTLLVLEEVPGAQPATGYTGLYHFALLLPSRRALAAWLAHAVRDRVPLTGLSDHEVSDAIYLRDPDHHGIEIYADRPRELWEGQVRERMTTRPLDAEGLLGELEDPAAEPFAGLTDGTVMGHVHLKARQIAETTAFYRDVLGFQVTAAVRDQAVFLAAGGYHHHLGANTWESLGASPPPAGTAALLHATIVLPDARSRDEAAERVVAAGGAVGALGESVLVRDPSGNALALAAD